MKIYKDLKTGDELISDAFAQLPPFDKPEFSDVAFEVRGKRIPKGEQDYGIARNTEEGEDTTDMSGVQMVVDVLDSFQVTEIPMTKKDFRVVIKDLMKTVTGVLEKKNPERIAVFKKNFMPFFQHLESVFSDLEFFFGSNSLDGGTPIFSYWVGEETAPRFVYIIDAMEVERV